MTNSTLREWENWALGHGYQIVAGVDEAGRGPLAGPVVASACILPLSHKVLGINDSKQLKASERKAIFEDICQDKEIQYGIGIVEAGRIDEINILQATFEAMRIALAALKKRPDFVLVDGNQRIPRIDIPQRSVIQGDSLSESIAAASIIAKQTRDALMLILHQEFPQYGFDKHKGYATKSHLEAIQKHGPCREHRASFEPIKSFGKKETALDLFS